MPPPYEDVSSPNGLQYAVNGPFGDDAPSTTERELLAQTIELCTFDWRRLVWSEAIQASHVVTFHWVDTPDGLDGVGGVRHGDDSYSAPSTAFVDGEGDLGVYAVEPGIGEDAMQPWVNQEHHIYLLRNIDLEPGVGNPLSVGGPKVFRDTVIRCLGMMVTWCGAVANPYARDRLARVYGWTGVGDNAYSYLDAEGGGSSTWWAESGFGADLGRTRDDVDNATLPWAGRINEHVAEAFKDRFLAPELREFTARTGAASGNCGWPLFKSAADTIDDIFLDEMGSYDWGTARDVATSSAEGGFSGGMFLYSADVSAAARHMLPTALPEDYPVPILEVAPNSPLELAEAKDVGGEHGYTIRFSEAPFAGGSYWLDNDEHPAHPGGPGDTDKWIAFNTQYPADLKSFDKDDSALLEMRIGASLSSGVIDEDPTMGDNVASIEWTAPPFYVRTGPVLERRSYTRSRVICNSRPIPPVPEPVGVITAAPRGPGIVAGRGRPL